MATLQGLSSPIATAVINGGSAATDLRVPGLSSADSLVSVHHITDDLVTNADVTSEGSVEAADGTIQLTTTDTTGDFLVVTWKKAV